MEVPGKNTDSGKEGNVENIDNVCEPCRNENTKTQADGFCKDCGEFMCNKCFKQHLKGRLCRHHVLVDGNFALPFQMSDERKFTCKLHDGEAVKFYCPTHEVVACGDCIILNHKTCHSEYIKDLSDNFQQNMEFKALKGNIQKLISESKDFEKEIQEKKRDNKLMLEEAVGHIRLFRLRIIEYLFKVEAAIVSEAKNIMRENETLLSMLEKDCKVLTTELEKATAMLNTELFKDNVLFIHTVECKKEVSTSEVAISDMKSKRMKKYEFVPDKQLSGLSASVQKLGTLSVSTSSVGREATGRANDNDGRSMVAVRSIKVQRTTEEGSKVKKNESKKNDDTVCETFHHRNGKVFQCLYQGGERFYLDETWSKEWQPFPRRWYHEGLLKTTSVIHDKDRKKQEDRTADHVQFSKFQGRSGYYCRGNVKGDNLVDFFMHPTERRVQTRVYKRYMLEATLIEVELCMIRFNALFFYKIMPLSSQSNSQYSKDKEIKEQADRTAGQSQFSKPQDRSGRGKVKGNYWEGFLIHPTKGRINTCMFYKEQKVHMYYDSGSWKIMPIVWELHHDMVKSLVDQVEEAVPSFRDRHDIIASLRACDYNPNDCIASYMHLENDVLVSNTTSTRKNLYWPTW